MKRYPEGFDYGLGEGVIRNKFKKGDILLDGCGCSWKVLRASKKSYTIQHLEDKGKITWEKEDCEEHLNKSGIKANAKKNRT